MYDNEKFVVITQDTLDDFLNEYYEKRRKQELAQEEREYISENEVKRMLHKSSPTIWRYVHRGLLDAPQKRLGRNYYKTKQVEALL